MKKKRNGLLELYRLFFCFWVMYYHEFFFFENPGDEKIFSIARLAVDFFFILSGFFLLSSMRKLKEEKVFAGAGKLMWSRLKPMTFSLLIATAFNAVCMALFIREDIPGVLLTNFRYWWYLLYMVLAIGILYLVFRWVKNEKGYAVFLAVLALVMGGLHYAMENHGFFIYEFTFVARTFGCLALGMLLSYIPKWKPKKFNYNILFVVVLVPLTVYLAYIKKDYWLSLTMLGVFMALIYFTSNINVGGKFCDAVGQLSVRMYIYMAFVSMLHVLGWAHDRLLFILDGCLATMDVMLSHYYRKFKELQKKILASKA
ncbi:MAG: hypothetical protein E7371_01440 [Clostridiales bacterium]|nr:hypothetical protein [Clostridiales bacterium]